VDPVANEVVERDRLVCLCPGDRSRWWRWMNFSNTKKKRIDPTTVNEIRSVRPPSSASSGRMWISASPSNAPTASPTRRGRMRLRKVSRATRARIPTREMRLTISTAASVLIQTPAPMASMPAGGYPIVAMVRSNLWSFTNVARCAALARDAPNGRRDAEARDPMNTLPG
jgi:hypothetical protein